MREISACISCHHAIIKKEKLENVTSRQSHLVNELKKEKVGQFEILAETRELEILQKMRKIIARDEKISEKV